MPIWLLTNTCYGTWLPGDPRGSVTSVRDRRPDDPPGPARVEHSQPGTPFEPDLPELLASARSLMKGPAVRLTRRHAEIMLRQFHETATFRGWTLHAAAVMWNHDHLVIDLEETPAAKALTDLKAYASRSLNREFGVPPSKTWWTMGGSKRRLPSEEAVAAAVRYVTERQPNPLCVWRAPEGSGR